MAERSLVPVLVAVSLMGCIALSGSLLARRRTDWTYAFTLLTVSLAVGLSAVSRSQGRTELDPWSWWLVGLAILIQWNPVSRHHHNHTSHEAH